MHPAALIAAPLIASAFTLPPVAYIDPAELSGLLEDCTGYTVDAETDADGMPAFYIVDPSGDRLEPDYPYPDLETVADVVGWRIDEALADCDP